MLPHLEETRMSWLPDQPPVVEAAPCPALETVIVARPRDLGGFAVRRALPATSRQMVGPFIFFDQMGPADFPAGMGIDVRPHPHIGLATVTYLFEGEVLHRDSLGTVQAIRPGAVNWMTAGRGIAHSERSDPVLRQSPQRLSGIQAWVALPARQEETEPAFAHYPQDALPVIAGEGKKVRLIAGSLYARRSRLCGSCSMPMRCSRRAPGSSYRPSMRSAPSMSPRGRSKLPIRPSRPAGCSSFARVTRSRWRQRRPRA
jgi:hypothetical protein